jgi:hypothetical protein
MKLSQNYLWHLALLTVMGLLGSVIAGLIQYGVDVVKPSTIAFGFVAYGLTGSFIFAFYHVRGLSNTITAAVTVSAAQFVASSFMIPIVNAAIWSFGINLPVVALAFVFEKKLSTFGTWKFVVVGLVYAATFVLMTLLVGVLTNVEALPADLFRKNFVDGLLLGLGLGLGIETGEAFLTSLELHHEQKK